MIHHLFTSALILTAGLASAYEDMPLVLIPIEDNVPVEPALPPINTPEPLLLPMIPNCEQFHLVSPGETCHSIASSVGMSVQELGALNPFIGINGKECARGLLAGYWCCVKSRGTAPSAANRPVQIPGFRTHVRGELENEEKKTENHRTAAPKTTVITVARPKPTSTEAPTAGRWKDISGDCMYGDKDDCPDWVDDLKTLIG
ncbi:hypothetical protein NLU13_7699 [Sarocladium strictum]|uniref:LysM domain-containing protein n=1 Tax=Sarocladium strictum TaxID=5046 RepID=A0AA39GDA6_SARSR|nr:hypothetical protein NLU13_7699 [Sarocladium strictum]